jgi:hypothetical protein
MSADQSPSISQITALQAGLRSPDERTRAESAQGLVRLGHPDAIAACVQTLNDAPDPLHLDITPAVTALGEMGLRAVTALLDPLRSNDEITRLRAQRALEAIVARRHGFRAGKGFPSTAAEEAMRDEWEANGSYDYSGNAVARDASLAKWRQWLATAKE